MRKLLPRLIVALSIAGSLFALSLSVSGAPTRVHVATGVGLLAFFVAPALLVRSPRDLLQRWLPVFALVLAGSVVYSVLSASVIAKVEFSVIPVLALLPVAALLLLVHGAIVSVIVQSGKRAV